MDFEDIRERALRDINGDLTPEELEHVAFRVDSGFWELWAESSGYTLGDLLGAQFEEYLSD